MGCSPATPTEAISCHDRILHHRRSLRRSPSRPGWPPRLLHPPAIQIFESGDNMMGRQTGTRPNVINMWTFGDHVGGGFKDSVSNQPLNHPRFGTEIGINLFGPTIETGDDPIGSGETLRPIRLPLKTHLSTSGATRSECPTVTVSTLGFRVGSPIARVRARRRRAGPAQRQRHRAVAKRHLRRLRVVDPCGAGWPDGYRSRGLQRPSTRCVAGPNDAAYLPKSSARRGIPPGVGRQLRNRRPELPLIEPGTSPFASFALITAKKNSSPAIISLQGTEYALSTLRFWRSIGSLTKRYPSQNIGCINYP